MTKTKLIKYINLHLLIILYSFIGVLSKLTSQQKFLSNYFLIYFSLTFTVVFIYAIIWQQQLKKMDLTTAFANKSVSVIWGLIWGSIIFQESISINMIIGSIIVLIGVIIVVKEDE